MRILFIALATVSIVAGPVLAVKHSSGHSPSVSGEIRVSAKDTNETPDFEGWIYHWFDQSPPTSWGFLSNFASTIFNSTTASVGVASSITDGNGKATTSIFAHVETRFFDAKQKVNGGEDNQYAHFNADGISKAYFEPDGDGNSTQHLWIQFSSPYAGDPNVTYLSTSSHLWVEGGTNPANEQWWIHATYRIRPNQTGVWDIEHSNGHKIKDLASWNNYWVRPVESFDGIDYYMESFGEIDARLQEQTNWGRELETDADFGCGSAIF